MPAVYPPRGELPWDDDLKVYVDDVPRAQLANQGSDFANLLSARYDLKYYSQHPARKLDAEGLRGVAPYFQWMLADWKILRTVTVANDTEFAAALSTALPGDEIVITGNLSNNYTADVNVMATAENPIIIRAQAPLSVKFTGQMILRRARYVYFVGFDMSTTGSVIMTGTDGGTYSSTNKIVGCRYLLIADPEVSLQFGASFNQVLFCEFDGSLVTGTTQIHGIILSLANDPKCVRTFGNRFAYNWFHDFPVPEQNDCSCIWLGQGIHSTNWNVGTIVEYNLFERCLRDDELISTKSSGNIIRYNEFRDSKRSGDGCWLTLRHGTQNQVYGNLLIGCGGIRVWGDDHIVSGNTVVGGDIEIQAGDTTQADLSVGHGWPAARRARVFGNNVVDGVIYIGRVFDPTVIVPAQDTQVYGNYSGTKDTPAAITFGLQTGTDSTTNHPNWTNSPLASRVR